MPTSKGSHRQVIRWGIIGAGDVVEHKSGPALQRADRSAVVAVMRRQPQKAQEFAERLGIPRWHTSVEALLNDDEVDAVYIASPHHLHLPHITAAAQAGKAILCETPIGVNAFEAQAAVAVCRAAGVSLSVAYHRRFWPVVQEMRRLLLDGAIGEVVQARVQMADRYEFDPQRAWLTDPVRAGGGALASAGSHWIDLIRFLLGEVNALNASSAYEFGSFRTEDTVGVQMHLDSRALAALNVTLCSPVPVNEFDIAGTEGRLLAAPLAEGRLLLHRRGHEPEWRQLPRATWAHSELVAAVVSSLLAGNPSPVPGEEAVAAWQVIAAAYRACPGRRHVRVVRWSK